MSEPSTNCLLAVDSHVHLYDWLNLVPMLDNALVAFTDAVQASKNSNDFTGILILVEPAARNTFDRLKDLLESGPAPEPLNSTWTLEATEEALSLCAVHTGGSRIYLISGQQVVTEEKLEVLSLFTDQTIPEGAGLEETIMAVTDKGGYPVLPWGVGKWLSVRGKIISNTIAANAGNVLALGDNGGRPGFWKHVSQFSEAFNHNLPVLHGSDPLPVSEMRRSAGSSGDILECPFDPARPGASLIAALKENRADRIGYGKPESLFHFVKDQITIRLG